jgi:hypothetical protein
MLPEEAPIQEEQPVIQDVQPELVAREKLKAMKVYANSQMFKGGGHKSGSSKIGITRKVKKVTKKAEKQSKDSRKKNHKIANKKFRPSGSKKK